MESDGVAPNRADDVLGLACGKGNRGWAKVRCTSLSWKKFLLAKDKVPVSLRRSSYYTKYSMHVSACS
jgi:hypothetical protein